MTNKVWLISIHFRVSASFFVSAISPFSKQIYSDAPMWIIWILAQWALRHSLRQRRRTTRSDSRSIKILIVNSFYFPEDPNPTFQPAISHLNYLRPDRRTQAERTNRFSQGRKQNAKRCVWCDCDWSNQDVSLRPSVILTWCGCSALSFLSCICLLSVSSPYL